jgi:basic amino acid/polyamine antiporter, APA family
VRSDEEGLRREIGFAGSAFLSFNGVVGAGIFALPETLYSQFGSFSPFLFPLFGALIFIIALPFSRTASHHRVSGGPVVYAAVFGRAASFQAGWLFYIARATAFAANANVLVAYISAYLPAVETGIGRAGIIVSVIGLITWINIIGVRRALRLIDILTLGKTAPLVIAALFGLVVAGAAIPAPSGVPPLDQLEAAALLTLYAFVGFENSVVPAGETRDPTRNIPRALLTTLAATALLYFIIQLAYVAVMAPGEGGDAPLAAFGEKLWGPAGALILSAAAIFSLLGNLSAGITATSRTTYALGRDRLLPGWFGRISESYATPANSIFFMGVLIALLALSGSFVWLAVISTLARLIVYSIGIAALPKAERPTFLWWVLILAGLGICIWAAFQTAWPSWRMLLILVAAGTILYWIARRQAASSASAGTVSEIQPPPSTRSPS